MMLMAERHRLLLRLSHARKPGGALKLRQCPTDRRQHKHESIDREARECVRAAMEYLRHRARRSCVAAGAPSPSRPRLWLMVSTRHHAIGALQSAPKRD